MTNVIMKDKLIIDEKLDQVAGGTPSFSGHVNKYKGVIGARYFIVNDDNPNKWFYGVLKESYEEKYLLWFTKRLHVVQVEKAYDGRCGRNCVMQVNIQFILMHRDYKEK